MIRKRTIDVTFILLGILCVLVGTNTEVQKGLGGLSLTSSAPLDTVQVEPSLSQYSQVVVSSKSSNKALILNNAPKNQSNLPFCNETVNDCFYGSVENVISTLEQASIVYVRLCALETKPRLARLVQVAGILGFTEGFSKTNPNKLPDDVLESINSLGQFSEFKFVNYLRELQISFQEDIHRNSLVDKLWLAISDELDIIIREGNYPFFLRRNVWQYMQNIRMVNMLKVTYGTDTDVCMPNTWKFITNLWEISFTPNFVTIFKPISKSCPSDVLEVKPELFINGGIVYTFWGFENLKQIKNQPKVIFRGFISNVLNYEYSLNASESQVVHVFKFLKEVIYIHSNSKCADYFFVTLAIQKDCDKYRITWSVRFLASNTRKEGSRTVFADVIENASFQFDKVSTFNHHLYKNIKYAPYRELLLMSYTSNANVLKNLLNRATCKNQGGKCLYSDLEKCVVCVKPLINLKGNCVSTCPDGTYHNGKGSCKPCAKECVTCTGPKNGDCKECKFGYLMNSGKCVTRCPDNMAPKQRICNKCGDNCLQCKDATTCSKCEPNHFLKDGQCVKNCGNFYYASFQPNTCNPCSNGCRTCFDAKTCKVCDKGFLMKQGRCVLKCGDRFYPSNETCQPCATGCLKCNNPKTCIICEKGLHLSKKSQTCVNKCDKGNVIINGACVPCGDKNCERCSPYNINECKKCNKITFLKSDKCVPSCGEGFYVDEKRRCQPCSRDCRICTKERCLQCFDNKVVFKDKICLNDCVDGYVRSGNVCVKCQDPTCKKCLPNNLSTCTKCYKGTYLFSGKCPKECPEKYYKNDDECSPCIKGCDVCKNGLRCEKCSKDWLLKDFTCVDCCGVGYTEVNNTCKRCTVHDCDFCDPKDVSRCDKCIKGRYLYNNICHKICPLGTYANQDKGCEKCGNDCALCRDKNTCLRCVIGKVLQGKVCQSFCNDGFIPINGICTPCNNNRCKKCDNGLTNCTECPIGSYLYKGDCVKVCPDGTYTEKGICQPCVKPCKECSSKTTCLDCIKGFFLIKKKCTDKCPDRYANVDGKCKKCADKECLKCLNSDLTTCILCKPDHFLHLGKCLKRCHEGFYAIGNVCHPCSIGCSECRNNQNCEKCKHPRVLYDGQCLEKCPSGTVQVGNVCNKCNPRCKTCSPKDIEICITCPTPYKLYQGRCEPNCPERTFSDLLGVCQNCQVKKCSRCSGGITCTECVKGYVLENNTCIQPPCSKGYVLRSGTNICIPCEVSNCAVCPQNDTKTCKDCLKPYLLVNGKCPSPVCPNGYFKLSSTQSCAPCSEKCKKCNDGQQCIECDTNYFLFDRRCRPDCPNGYVKFDGKCLPCNTKNCSVCTPSGKKCIDCIKGYVRNENQCVTECPKGKWPLLKRCVKCPSGCADCCDGSRCDQCEKGKVLTDDGKCVDNCPLRHVSVDGKCVKCDAGDHCLKCNAKNRKDCDVCEAGYYIKNGKCVNNCGNGFTALSGKCTPCSNNCAVCSHPEKCDTCENKYFLFDNKCNPTCPLGTYQLNGKCVKCTEKCIKCNAKKCEACGSGYLVLKGKCVSICPRGTFIKIDKCKKCGKNCLDCESRTTCKVCKDQFYIKDGECVSDCGVGFVPVTGKCAPCGPSCNSCNKLNIEECFKCNVPQVLQNGKCSPQCKTGYYVQNGECKPCFKGCDICNNPITCTKCTPPLVLSNDQKSCSSLCPDGYMPNNGKCASCEVEKCKSCDNNIKRCIECKLPSSLFDNQCRPLCPQKLWFRTEDGKNCKKCPIGCLTCAWDRCISCLDGYTLENRICINQCKIGEVDVKGKCVPCAVKDCEKCDSTTLNCFKCKSGLVLDIIKGKQTCVDCCGEGWFDNKGTCSKCVENCNKCYNNKECAVCNKGFVLQNGQCVIRCSPRYVQRDLKCHPCEDNKCLRCDPQNQAQCSLCDKGYYLKNGKCVSECGLGYYSYKIGDNEYICKPCDKNCNVCHGNLNCKVCDKGFYIKKGECVPDCGTGFTADPITKNCIQCYSNTCVRCDVNNPGNCKNCLSGNYIENGQCVKKCSPGYRLRGEVCEPCTDKNCIRCKESANKCNRCTAKMVVLNGECVNSCPKRMVPRNGVCVKCVDPNCNLCHPEKTDKCVDCRDGYLSDSNKNCKQNCPAGTYSWKNVKCLPCPGNCKRCSDEKNCIECNTGFKFNKNKICTDKCDNGQVKVNGKCLVCKVPHCRKCNIKNLNECILCNPGLLIVDGKCVKYCPQGSYRIGNTCRKCSPNCLICINGETCSKCVPPTVIQGNFCVTKCEDGYFAVNGICQKCNNFLRTKECDQNKPPVCREKYFLYNNKCVDFCPRGTNADINRVCQPCGNNCIQCSRKDECEKCDSKTVLHNSKCYTDCPTGYVNVFGKCLPCKGLNCLKCRPQNLAYCEECKAPLITYKGVCVSQCPAGTYLEGRRCRKCDPACETCKQKGSCITCKIQFSLLDGKCLSKCPIGYVLVQNTCIACQDPNCKVCSSSNINKCSDCKDKFILFGGQCLKNCPSGLYMNIHTNTCEPCSKFCETCNATTCTKCVNGFYPYAKDPRHCVPCRDNQHVIENGLCTRCKPSHCLKCVKGNSEKCETCHVSKILLNGKCENHCPAGFYRVGQSCAPCNANCKICRNPERCDVCNVPFINFKGKCIDKCPQRYVYNGVNKCDKCAQTPCLECERNLRSCKLCDKKFILYNKECHKVCPDGTFKINNSCQTCKTGCQLCSSATNCIECSEALKLRGKDCVKECGIGYIDKGKKCTPCTDSNCAVCSPVNKCHTCKTPYLLNYNGACVPDCKDGTYRDNNNSKCILCDKGCELCKGKGKCTKCEKGLLLHNGVCEEKCPAGFAPSNSNTCVPCEDKNCKICKSSAHICNQCKTPMNVFNGKCIEKCPEGYYSSDGRCKKCNNKCKICKDKNTCIKCKTSFALIKGECVNNCPDGKVLINEKCIPCSDPNCKTCLTNVNICVTCKTPYLVFEKLCRTTCPNGYYANENGECVTCGVGCAQCKNNKKCDKCLDGYYDYNGKCLKTCPIGYYGECKERVCKKCNEACEVCTDGSSTNCKHCAKGFYLDGNSCVRTENCRRGTYPDNATRKCATCTIPFCATCLDFDTCDVCVNGYSVNSNGGCSEAKTFVNVIPSSPKLLSQVTQNILKNSETKNFNNDLKGVGIGSKSVTYSFFIRRITEYKVDTTIFQTISSENSINVVFYISNNSCFLRVGSSTNRVADCSYENLYPWQFFTVVLDRKGGNINVTVFNGTQNGEIRTVANFVTSSPKNVKLVIRSSNIKFNSQNSNAFELSQFNIFDYIPNKNDVEQHFKNKPIVCDFACTDCRDRCYKCIGGVEPVNGNCPAQFVPVANDLQILTSKPPVMLRTKLDKRLDSYTYGFTTWFYSTNPSNTDYTVGKLYYSYQPETIILEVKIVKNSLVVVVGNQVIGCDDAKVNPNTWYHVGVTLNLLSANIWLTPRDGLRYTSGTTLNNPLRLLTEDATFSVNNFIGSYFDGRVYVNNIPTPSDITQHENKLRCPKNCSVCNQAMRCVRCINGFALNKDYKCIDNELGPHVQGLDKYSFFNKETYTLNVPDQFFEKPFSLSFWYRKKIHSVPDVPPQPYFNVLSYAPANSPNTLFPIVQENILPPTHYTSKFTIGGDCGSQTSFTENFSDEVYSWIHFVLNFYPRQRTVTFNIQNDNKVKFVGNYTYNATKFVFGDNKGSDMNFEIGNAFFYGKPITEQNLPKVKETEPKDCDSTCIKCNYLTGHCNECQIKKPGVNLVCPNMLLGYASAYTYNVQKYDAARGKLFTSYLKNTFTRDVNSLEYSVIGYFRLLDLDLMNLHKNNRFSLFTVANRQDNKKSPSNNLIGLHIRTENGKPSFNWILNDHNTVTETEIIGLPVKANAWYFVYATINVVKKRLDFAFHIEEPNTKTLVGEIDLQHFPEKLQERGSLTLFGVGQDLPNDYKIPNAHFFYFYLSPNLRWNPDLINKYRQTYPIKPDPKCSSNCIRCIHDYSRSVDVCLKCKTGFEINNDKCVKALKSDYIILSDQFNKNFLPPKTDFSLPQVVTNSPKSTLAFYFQRNYVPRNFGGNRVIMNAGALSVSLLVTQTTTATIVFEIRGVSQNIGLSIIDSNFENDYDWYLVLIHYSKNEIRVIVKDEDGKKVGDNFLQFNSVNLIFNTVSFNSLNQEVSIYGPHIMLNYYYQEPIFGYPKLNCGIDCNACVMDKCVDCQYGTDALGRCKNKPIKTHGFLVEKDSGYVNRFPVDQFIVDNKFLRTSSWTILFTFQSEVDISQLAGRTLFRLQNTKTTEYDSNLVNDNLFAVKFNKDRSFFLTANTRHYQNTIKSAQGWTSKSLKKGTNNQFFVGIIIDDDADRIHLYIYNSPTNFIRESFTFDGTLDNLVNSGTLIFGEGFENDKKGIIFDNTRFYYEQILTLDQIEKLAPTFIINYQNICASSSRSACQTCSQGTLIQSEGRAKFCSPTPTSFSWYINHVIQFDETNQNSNCTGIITNNDPLNSFTFSFWYRRTSYTNDPHGVVSVGDVIKINYDSNVLTINVEEFNCTVVGSIRIPNLYDKTDGLDWLHITISVDVKNNVFQVLIHNARSGANRYTSAKINVKSLGNIQNLPVTWSISTGECIEDSWSYEIASFIFNPNYYPNDTSYISLYRLRVPINCESKCGDMCDKNNICPLKFRYSSQFTLPAQLLSNGAKVPLYRGLNKQFGKTLYSSPSFSRYLIGFELNLNFLQSSTYKSNKNVLINLNNDVLDCSKDINNVIPDSLFKYGLLSVEFRTNALRFYVGGSKANSYASFYDFVFESNNFKGITNIQVSYYADAFENYGKIIIYIDDLRSSYEIKTVYPLHPISRDTVVYTHPAISNFRINVHNPRFNFDFTRNILNKSYVSTYQSNLCKSRKNCEKCAVISKSTALFCERCTNGYKMINNMCLIESSFKK